jgi:L-rhamnose mutarotase
MEKYFGQQCQDDTLNQKFRELHKKIVDEIISFCKENNIVVDEIHLNADGVSGSIPYGEWQACTDSYFGLDKFTDEYWDVLSMKKHVTNEEWKKIKAKQEPFLVSM